MIKGVILVGGPSKGTEFRPLSLDIPKPLFPVAGLEMITHQISALAKIPKFSTLYILGFYDPRAFSGYIKNIEKTYDITVKYLQEEKSYGTAGGLYLYRKEIFSDDATVVVVHCDICSNFPFPEVLDFHKAHGKTCTIVGTNVPSETAQQYGCLIQDKDTHELIHIANKPESYISDLINCGIYALSSSMVGYLEAAHQKKSTNLPVTHQSSNLSMKNLFKLHSIREDSISLEKDVIMPLAGNKKAYLFRLDQSKKENFWFQIKDFEALLTSSTKYLEHYRAIDHPCLSQWVESKTLLSSNVIIHPGAQVHASAKIGPNVTIGAGVKVGAGVRIKNAIILDGVEIYPNCCVMNAIIGWNSIIGSWTRVEGSKEADSKESLCILGVGVAVDPELCIRNCIVLPHKEISESHSNKVLL